jgi:hypothetical protein
MEKAFPLHRAAPAVAAAASGSGASQQRTGSQAGYSGGNQNGYTQQRGSFRGNNRGGRGGRGGGNSGAPRANAGSRVNPRPSNARPPAKVRRLTNTDFI